MTSELVNLYPELRKGYRVGWLVRWDRQWVGEVVEEEVGARQWSSEGDGNVLLAPALLKNVQ